jgi:hypothetical protein
LLFFRQVQEAHHRHPVGRCCTTAAVAAAATILAVAIDGGNAGRGLYIIACSAITDNELSEQLLTVGWTTGST